MRSSLLFYLALFTHAILCSSFEDNGIGEYEQGGADLAYLGSSVFGKPSAETGKKVENWDENSEVNPEELGEYAEGDILFPNKVSKNGLIAETARWKDGEVPYEISGYFSGKEKETIKNAMQQYHKLTCIRFRLREKTDSDWIAITSGSTGCWSSVGRTGGRQEVNLQSPGCLTKIGTVMHELLHAIGFQHEQNRWERDDYVSIHWENILKGREGNFKKGTKESVTGFGVPYDYGSVMHYSEKAFSKNGQQTITVLEESEIKIGQREGFSTKDLEKIRLMYDCPPAKENGSEAATVTDHSDGGNGSQGVLGGLLSMLFPK